MINLTGYQWILLIGAAIIVGFSKTGISGAGLPAIAMIAYSFGAKASSGVMLTMLIAGDLIAVFKYGKYGNMKDVMKVLPPAVVGIILGAVVGNYLNDAQFKFLLGIIVTVCLVLLIYKEIANKSVKVPQNKFYHGVVGVVSGFTSMVGNAAGPIFSVYLLSMSFEKNKFIGTTAWVFFAINLIKVPFLVFMWKTITFDSLQYTVYMLPFIILGAIVGIYLVKKINEKLFRHLVIIMTAIVAIKLVL